VARLRDLLRRPKLTKILKDAGYTFNDFFGW
jgi:hypothetical protein